MHLADKRRHRPHACRLHLNAYTLGFSELFLTWFANAKGYEQGRSTTRFGGGGVPACFYPQGTETKLPSLASGLMLATPKVRVTVREHAAVDVQTLLVR
jgi:hypothetical protein